MTPAPSEIDVAIVGLGPVGITLANLLAADGHTVVAVEAAPDIFDLPRAIGLDQESLRTFQQLGLSARLEPFIDNYRPSEYLAADGAVLRRFVAPAEPFPLAWPPNVTFVQPQLERLLRDRARDWPNLSLRLATAVTAIEHIDTRPALGVRDVRTGITDTITCRYVVACDGSSSFVRKALSIASEDLGFDEPWLVVDILLSAEVDLPELNIQFCDPKRPMTYVRGPGQLRRWEIMMLPGDDASAMVQPERIWQLLRPWLRPDQARIWRAATYRFHALVAETWRRGQVFLAGDAAHQMPPFIAQGLNQGIRDAANLAWKLSAVLRGGAPAQLLDTYEIERRPNVRSVIATTKELGRVICERDPKAAAERDDRMKAVFATGAGTSVRQELLPPLKAGLVARDSQGQLVRGAGEACPQPWIVTSAGRTRLDDLLGRGIHVLIGPEMLLDQDITRLAGALHARIVRVLVSVNPEQPLSAGELVVVEENRLLAHWMASRACQAIVARPDHVVFGTATDSRALAGLLASLNAALGLHN